MRWFFHRRSPPSPGGTQWYRLLLHAACCVRPSYGTRPTAHCQLGWVSSFSFFCSWWPWPLIFDIDLRTRARFLYNVHNRHVWSSYV